MNFYGTMWGSFQCLAGSPSGRRNRSVRTGKCMTAREACSGLISLVSTLKGQLQGRRPPGMLVLWCSTEQGRLYRGQLLLCTIWPGRIDQYIPAKQIGRLSIAGSQHAGSDLHQCRSLQIILPGDRYRRGRFPGEQPLEVRNSSTPIMRLLFLMKMRATMHCSYPSTTNDLNQSV